MEDPIQLYNIAEEIRLAVAPVFLLTALGALLTLLSQRLTRFLDRMRALPQEGDAQSAQSDMRLILRKLLNLIQWAIRCSATAAILTCLVVIGIFASDVLLGDLSRLISGLFIVTMLLIIVSLLLLLIDIGFSVSSVEGLNDP